MEECEGWVAVERWKVVVVVVVVEMRWSGKYW